MSRMMNGILARAGLCALLMTLPWFARAAEVDRSGGPYVPTPQVVVDNMLRMANVTAKDYVIDLG